MDARLDLRFLFVLLFAALAFSAASCVRPLGPGYTIENQQVRVQFVPAPEPLIRIAAAYQLKNTGNQPLGELELRLPGRRRFRHDEPRASWDNTALEIRISPENPRNAQLSFPESWTVSSRHTLHLSVEYLPALPEGTTLSFSGDAFFLPAQGWSPELLPSRGLFATGGVPPKKWELSVRVPEGFLVHTSGEQVKTSPSAGELIVRAIEREKDRYPFVIAGRYTSAEIGSGKERIYLWTRKAPEAAGFGQVSDALIRTLEAYDSLFGSRSKDSSSTWIVECPMVAGCFTNLNPWNTKLWGEVEKEAASAEMISLDTMVVDLSGGLPKLAAATPLLASSWLGYAQNPGFYEEEPPLSAFPIFAASIGREAAEGRNSRTETIRRALRMIPEEPEAHHAEDQAVLQAKGFLFFYALEDRYGREVFRKAIRHMLDARRGRGLELSDLVAAFEQETHQNVAEFVRIWMKRPGVPEEFRARYAETARATDQSAKEITKCKKLS